MRQNRVPWTTPDECLREQANSQRLLQCKIFKRTLLLRIFVHTYIVPPRAKSHITQTCLRPEITAYMHARVTLGLYAGGSRSWSRRSRSAAVRGRGCVTSSATATSRSRRSTGRAPAANSRSTPPLPRKTNSGSSTLERSSHSRNVSLT